jgi:hypothetical protein
VLAVLEQDHVRDLEFGALLLDLLDVGGFDEGAPDAARPQIDQDLQVLE